MKNPPTDNLSRRERQIMDLLYAQGEASAADVQAALPDQPTDSTVRTLLRRLVDKGQVRYRQDGPRYLYRPLQEPSHAGRSALQRLISTFFGGSPRDALMHLLGEEADQLSDADLDAIEASLQQLRERGKKR